MSEFQQEQIKELLEENKQVLQENHQILEKLHRIHKLQFLGKIIWLMIIIGIPVLLYYVYLEPMLLPLLEVYQDPSAYSESGVLDKVPENLRQLLDS